MEKRNAIIKSTKLGFDGGVFTFYLHIEFEGGGQGAGGYILDDIVNDPNGKFSHRQGIAAGMDLIMKILETVGVQKWEDLPGTYLRFEGTNSKIHSIGHIIKDKWLNFDEHFKDFGYGN